MQLLGVEEVLLTQSDAWVKAGNKATHSQSNSDQRFHMDYGNHTFLHPPPWEFPEAVAAIVYLSDIGGLESCYNLHLLLFSKADDAEATRCTTLGLYSTLLK